MDTQPQIIQEYRHVIAPKGKRFLAFVIDIGIFAGLLLLIRQPVIELAASYFGVVLTHTTPEEMFQVEKFYTAVDCILGLPMAILVYLIPPLFFKDGQTVGKKIMGLMLIHKDGGKPKIVHLLARTLIGFWMLEYVPSILLYFAAFFLTSVFVLVNKEGRALHDIVGKTIVVDKKTLLVDIIQKPVEVIIEEEFNTIEEKATS